MPSKHRVGGWSPLEILVVQWFCFMDYDGLAGEISEQDNFYVSCLYGWAAIYHWNINDGLVWIMMELFLTCVFIGFSWTHWMMDLSSSKSVKPCTLFGFYPAKRIKRLNILLKQMWYIDGLSLFCWGWCCSFVEIYANQRKFRAKQLWF